MNIPFERLYEMTNLLTLVCILHYEGYLYLTFFSVIQLVITSMADIASKVGVTIAHSVIQWSNVIHGIGYLKSVQLEDCMTAALGVYLTFISVAVTNE